MSTKKIIFTNGCFDLLHRGHIELLNFCKSLGDKVIVGLNSDTSVKRLKGKSRPINCEKDRKIILEALSSVDEVIIFEEDTPRVLINQLQPDIIVKGGDYDSEDVVGNDVSEIVIFDYLDEYSTTNTIQNINNR
jgi:rfaE bifunctional protein nucleotidyltransferase chain/domain